MSRHDGRGPGDLRSVKLAPDFVDSAAGSVLVDWGGTKVLCTASLDERVPPWMRRSGKGWVTAEYSMLPGSTAPRANRERRGIGGRSQEIQRLIARSLRQAVAMEFMGEKQIYVDCDVLQADGGTRTASITGGWVALAIAIHRLAEKKVFPDSILKGQIAAVSVGLRTGEVLTDLDYHEDSRCDVDANFVFARDRGLVEVQGTGEKATFTKQELISMLDYSEAAAEELFSLQQEAVRSALGG